MGSHRVYRERKFEFGKQLLELRTRMALTQSQLAQQIGVHWRTFQNWETSESYPKAETLQRLIAVCLRQHAFTPGKEREEAQALWRQAGEDGPHALASFDKAWFARTIALEAPAPLATQPKTEHTIIDLGEVIAVPNLAGRQDEMASLWQWIVDDRCRVVTIVGLGGIGKSSLALTFAHSALSAFEVVLFRSLQNGPPLAEVLDHAISVIAKQPMTAPEQVAQKIAMLVQLLRQRRCLLILDNLETIMSAGELSGAYQTGYGDYGELIQALSTREHQSCLLLTSREKPAELGALEGRTAPVRTMQLMGLVESACRLILEARDIVASPQDIQQLARLYGGNPLALNLVSEPIRELFGGDVATYLTSGHIFFNGVDKLMELQCSRTAPLEKSILYWLAIERDLVPLETLFFNLGDAVPRRDVFVALESLRRRVQVERSPDQPTFTLQPVILEFVTEQVISGMFEEVMEGKPRLLQSHALIQTSSKDYVRHRQERLLAGQLLERLLVACRSAQALEQRLVALLDYWREQPQPAQGYGPGNVANLLRLLRGDLRALNLSRLALRQVYWQGVEAQDSNLAHAWLRDNLFTEAFGIVHTVAASPGGTYWAASSINGAVHLWRDEGRTTHLSIPAHRKQVKALAFSPDEQILATCSWDCTIKLWETKGGALLRTLEGHTDYVQAISFAPDGKRLASGSDDRSVRIWDVATGTLLKTIQAHSDNTYGVVWSADGRWVASCGFDHQVRLWDMDSGNCLQSFAGHTRPISKVAFSPDGRMLASGGFDRTVRIWDVASGECIKVYAEHSSTIMAIVWSPDGRTIASCSYDGTIRLWHLSQERAQHVLLGHRASVNSIAFSAGGKLLLSGSDDQTVRVWDVASGWCVRVIEGYGLFFYGLVWSPDGRSLLSANSDTTLTIWNVADGRMRLTLRGHTHTVYGVAWSPDGRWLASSGFDQTVRIWDAERGLCVRVIPAHTDTICRVAWWSPHGRWLASAGRDQAVRIWEVATGTSRWVGRGHSGPVNEVVWSPDGRRLASCGEDRTVRLWRAEDGELLQTLNGHESSVAGLAWSPDGQRLASCGGGGVTGELFLWDAKSGERLNSLTGHDSVISRVAWSRDSKRLFSGGLSGAIHWRDAQSGATLYTRQGHQGWIRSLSVSPDGTMLVSSGEDGVIHLWDIEGATLMRTLRADRPYERMQIGGLNGITQAQRAALLALGAQEQYE